jgi:3-isopropylmalate/(R)-2-methylmalate dehydratase large subunit
LRSTVRFEGKILFLTEDADLLRRQLAGERITRALAGKLIDNISTDEITPGWVCFHYDEKLGEYALIGLRGNVIGQNDLWRNRFDVIVSGRSKGCGSSRETAPYAEKVAGARLIVAETIEKIYGQNCTNIGLLTTTDFGILDRIERGEEIPIDEFTKGLDPISADIVRMGGLFEYSKARMKGSIAAPPVTTPARPMTMVEKICAAHVVTGPDTVGVPAVKPGDAVFLRTDVRFTHEYVTPMAESLFKAAYGKDAKVADPDSTFAFRDHLTFLGQVMPAKHREMGLLEKAEGLATTQEAFTKRQRIKLYGEVPEGGSEAICHNAVVEDLALPGQVVTGTDSHTCMAGVLGAFAFGVGSTDMANAWATKDIRTKVPETVRFHLTGRLAPDVCAKDVMLHLLAMQFFKKGDGIGKVIEFTGDGTMALAIDERATLANMSVEAGGMTGIVEADEAIVEYLATMRGADRESVRRRIVRSDPDATYALRFDVDLSKIPPMVATPGDPRNGIPVRDLAEPVKIDIAYGGSCTGGKMADMDMYASVLSAALARGEKVSPGVRLYLQFGSQKIRRYAESKGYVDVFRAVGAELVNPSCGACIKAGPGASMREDEVTVSSQNRNFPGRSGPGKVYLASPLTVAASAIAGRIVSPDEVLRARAA